MPITKRRKTEPNYGVYIHRVMKQVHPGLSISSRAIQQTNSMVEDLLTRVIAQSSKVAIASKKSTLSSKHVQAATKVAFPFELSKHAISEGTKAVSKFTA
jgi:histone H2B